MEYISPVNKLNFSYMPSLLHMASVKVASHLIMDPDIGEMLNRALPLQYHGFQPWRYELWKSIEKTAKSKLPPLPPPLGFKIAKFIHPMFYSIADWLHDHDLYYHEDTYFYIKRNIICWKSNGTIDREQTAKKIIREETFDLIYRFKLACTYYFQQDIYNLWSSIKKAGIKRSLRKGSNPAVRFWIKYIKKGKNKKHTDELLIKYFDPERYEPKDINFIHFRLSCYFRFLPREYKCIYLLTYLYSEIHSDDFILCLKQMDEAERIEYFQFNHIQVLNNCIQWPFYSLYVKAVEEFSSYLTLHEFENILDDILRYHIREGFDCYKLFTEIWNIIPESYKDEIYMNENKFDIIQKTLNHKTIDELTLMKSVEKYCAPLTLD